MTNDNEEKALVDKLTEARIALNAHVAETRKRKLEQNRLEQELANAEQSAVDYMLDNGLLQTDKMKITISRSVEIEDVDAVPERYIRTKITKEPNKILIREEKPDANWYAIKTNYNITTLG